MLVKKNDAMYTYMFGTIICGVAEIFLLLDIGRNIDSLTIHDFMLLMPLNALLCRCGLIDCLYWFTLYDKKNNK